MKYSIQTLFTVTTLIAGYLALTCLIARESGRIPYLVAGVGFLYFFGHTIMELIRAAILRNRSGNPLLILEDERKEWRWHLLVFTVISLFTIAAVHYGVAVFASCLIPLGLVFHLTVFVAPPSQLCDIGIVLADEVHEWDCCSCRILERSSSADLEVRVPASEATYVTPIPANRVDEVRAILAEKQRGGPQMNADERE